MSFSTIMGMRYKRSRKYSSFSPPSSSFSHQEAQLIQNCPYNQIPKVIDHPSDLIPIINNLNNVFGQFITITPNTIMLRGKIDYKGDMLDPDTQEKQTILTISNPRALYQGKQVSEPIPIRIPTNSNIRIGSYAEIRIDASHQRNDAPAFVLPENITALDIHKFLPHIDWDYNRLKERLHKYGFEFREIEQSWRKIGDLSSADILLFTRGTANYHHNEVRGAVTLSMLKTTHDQDGYNLEVVDDMLNCITPQVNGPNTLHQSIFRGTQLTKLPHILSTNHRDISRTQYPNYFGCSASLSLRKYGDVVKGKFLDDINQTLEQTCVDLVNPISHLVTPGKSYTRKLLQQDHQFVEGSKLLLLIAQLLPSTCRIGDVSGVSAQEMRVADMLSKLDFLGEGEVCRPVVISEDEIDRARHFLKMNRENMQDFLTREF